MNSRETNQINYAYGSTTDSLFKQCFPVQVAPTAVWQAGVMDYILHPAEPARKLSRYNLPTYAV
jgi:hypothetical protein